MIPSRTGVVRSLWVTASERWCECGGASATSSLASAGFRLAKAATGEVAGVALGRTELHCRSLSFTMAARGMSLTPLAALLHPLRLQSPLTAVVALLHPYAATWEGSSLGSHWVALSFFVVVHSARGVQWCWCWSFGGSWCFSQCFSQWLTASTASERE